MASPSDDQKTRRDSRGPHHYPASTFTPPTTHTKPNPSRTGNEFITSTSSFESNPSSPSGSPRPLTQSPDHSSPLLMPHPSRSQRLSQSSHSTTFHARGISQGSTQQSENSSPRHSPPTVSIYPDHCWEHTVRVPVNNSGLFNNMPVNNRMILNPPEYWKQKVKLGNVLLTYEEAVRQVIEGAEDVAVQERDRKIEQDINNYNDRVKVMYQTNNNTRKGGLKVDPSKMAVEANLDLSNQGSIRVVKSAAHMWIAVCVTPDGDPFALDYLEAIRTNAIKIISASEPGAVYGTNFRTTIHVKYKLHVKKIDINTEECGHPNINTNPDATDGANTTTSTNIDAESDTDATADISQHKEDE